MQIIVKAADKLSAYIKCLEELKAGNTEFESAARQTRQAMDQKRDIIVKQRTNADALEEIEKKIQEKYKDNPQVMQQKVGALYKEAGVNPLAGCLPLLIQMPILMGMYYALYNFTYPTPESAAFLWLPNMSDPDPYYILPVLSALTTFLQQKQTTTEMNQQMMIMMTVMPLFIGWISLNFPSGLVLYWVTMNIVQITQQWWMYRNDDKKKEAA